MSQNQGDILEKTIRFANKTIRCRTNRCNNLLSKSRAPPAELLRFRNNSATKWKLLQINLLQLRWESPVTLFSDLHSLIFFLSARVDSEKTPSTTPTTMELLFVFLEAPKFGNNCWFPIRQFLMAVICHLRSFLIF